MAFHDSTGDIVHDSGKFFKVEGLRTETNYGPIGNWDQPIINQPEIGILGIISKVFNGTRHFLMQAKMEPGNINLLQLSPTVQATRSNYSQVHQGSLPTYLEYFLNKKGRILVDQLQSEQGTRFQKKRNRNIILSIDEPIEVHDDFKWLTLGEIKQLLKIDNLVNMDSRSVLSCISFVDDEVLSSENKWPSCVQSNSFGTDLFESMCSFKEAKHSLDEILIWVTDQKMSFDLIRKKIPLKEISGWSQNDWSIQHETGKFFSVIAVRVTAGSREVTSWTQPLIEPSSKGTSGFLISKINGVLHVLMQARIEPGMIDIIELSPTLSSTGGENCIYEQKTSEIDLLFRDIDGEIMHTSSQSLEGGRFYHDENLYLIKKIDQSIAEHIELPSHFIWMTLGQIMELVKYNNYVNIDTRELLACLNFIDET